MERPVGVSVISVLYFIGAGILVLCALVLLVGFGALSTHASRPGMAMLVGLGAVGAVICGILAAIAIVVGWGLWMQREWARIVALVLSGLSILVAVPGIFAMSVMHFGFIGLPFALVRIGINAVIIWYLLQPQVRQAFVRV